MRCGAPGDQGPRGPTGPPRGGSSGPHFDPTGPIGPRKWKNRLVDVSAIPIDERPGADFELVRELGRGSSSVVHLARQRSLNRAVALKRLHRALSGDPDTTARLRREGHVIARLDHPGIVRLYDLLVEGSDVVLVMEYVPGPSLQPFVVTAAAAPGAALAIVGDLAAALDHAAERGVVHRDVKPANVLMTETGRAKLGDFGRARIASDRSLFATSDGRSRGTPLYMSPELLRGGTPIPKSDVYSLALVALELLAGGHPFAGLTVRGVVEAHLDGGAAVAAAASRLPGRVVDVLGRGLSLAPADRPTAGEFIDGLRRAAPGAWLVPGPRPVVDPAPRSPRDGGDGWAGATEAGGPAVTDRGPTPADAAGPAIPADPVGPGIRPAAVATPARRQPRGRRSWPIALAAFAVAFAVILGLLELILH
jgi:eukaryotic-like serine/threonine-protein kinase